ncbi:MAG: CBS domain-containing protein [Nocardioidaceae bacterium]
MRIKDVLHVKGDMVVTVAPEVTVRDLLSLLAEHNIGAVVVSSDGTTVSGIVSERDVVRALVRGVEILDGAVSEIMTAEVRTAALDETVDGLMRLMTEHRIRHVPVLVDDGLHGIVSIGDVVKSRIGELEFERDQLTSYVAGAQ